jgi:DNA-binding transcriptional regulator YiaG
MRAEILKRVELEDMLTKNEVARFLHVNPRTLDNWKLEDKGPRPVKIGRKLLYPISRVKAFIEEESKKQYDE